MANKITVVLYTVPNQACCFGKMTWSGAAQMLQQQLRVRLGEAVHFQHIEFMTDPWFADAQAQEIMEEENLTLPFVLVGGKLASIGDKINISRVVRQAESLLHSKA
jgi:hypothetical protein